MDIPFDELYHKEKNMVDAIVKAEQALKAKEATLPDPMGAERIIDQAELQNNHDIISRDEFSIEH